ncbi:MAG TPA: 2'-5' RNA ligase family protein [Candidatus Angelobacter sp.]|jgi:2'-5' RNA ligase/GGDEF domain-containing protein|nr:2'-5' RNA ligase family protein [Candidatus Angelobacter sp.]
MPPVIDDTKKNAAEDDLGFVAESDDLGFVADKQAQAPAADSRPDFTQEALSGKLAQPAGKPTKLPAEQPAPAAAIPRGRGDVSQAKDGYFPPTDIPIQGVKDIAEGYQGFSGLPVPLKAMPAARGQMPRPVQPQAQVSPEDQEVLTQQENQRAASAAKMIQGAGEVGTVALPGSIAAAPLSTVASIGAGVLSSKAAGKAVHGKVSPEAEDLVRATAFFIPSVLGTAAGVKGASMETPKGKFSAVEALGGKVRAGIARTPDVTSGRVKIGDTQFEVNIPRGGKPAPPPALDEATAAMVQYEQGAGNIPKPPTPVPPGQQFGNKLSGDQIDHLAQTIAKAPPDQQNALIEEAHGRMVSWINDNNGRVFIDGKVVLSKSPDQTEALAAKIINDASSAHDKNQIDLAKANDKAVTAAAKEKEKQSTAQTARPASPAPAPKPVAAPAKIDSTSKTEAPQSQPAAEKPVVQKVEEKPAHEFASTQVNIDPKSELGQQHAQAVVAIPDEHIGPNGKEDTPHVTVRYGLKDDSPEAIAKIKEAASKIAPFEATVGKTSSFPATKEGDSPIIARVEKSPELNALRSAVEGAGNFKEDTHGEYKPHVTLGYVKPEHVAKYEGGNHLEGGKVPVDHIVVSKRDGTSETIKLGGKPVPDLVAQHEATPDLVAEHEAQPERRRDAETRKRLEQMSPEEKDAEIASLRAERTTAKLDNSDGTFTKLPIPSAVAFHEAPPSKAVGMSDADGLKAVNDKYGYKAGNALLLAKAEALKEAGLDAYHQKGDEFLGRGDSTEDVKAKFEKARDILRNREFTVTDADGKQVTMRGVDFSYGTGKDLAEAQAGLHVHKAERKAAGAGARGEFGRISETGSQTADHGGTEEVTHALPEGIPAKGQAGRVPVKSLTLAPKEFQYKLNTNEHGVTNLLSGQKWNDSLAGVVSVWHNPANGKTYVVNGHHRVQLAKQNGQKDLLAQHLNVNSASEARAMGALQNIAEGRGTAVDAAKFFRERGITPADLEKHGVSMGEATAENGLALSKLDPYLFDKVVSGELSHGRGIAIGKSTDNPATQEAILKLIEKAEKRGRRITDGQVAELARFAGRAKETTIAEGGLFGNSFRTENNALDKAEVSDYIKQKLSQEKRVFGAVSSDSKAEVLGQVKGQNIKAGANQKIALEAAQAGELYDKLSSSRGPIDDILENAAQRIAKRENPATVKADAYKQARTELRKTLPGVEGQGTERVQEDSDRRSGNEEANRQASVKPSSLEEFRNPEKETSEASLPEWVDRSELRRLNNRITVLNARAAKYKPVWEKPNEIPGAYVAGPSNYTMGNKLDAENNRKAEAFRIWQDATKESKHLEMVRDGYVAGKNYANGQKRVAGAVEAREAAAGRNAEKVSAQGFDTRKIHSDLSMNGSSKLPGGRVVSTDIDFDRKDGGYRYKIESPQAATKYSQFYSSISRMQGSGELRKLLTAQSEPVVSADEPALPGMAPHIEANKESAAATQGEDLSKKLTERKSISSKTGEMERNSPLFRDSEASGQTGLFGEKLPTDINELHKRGIIPPDTTAEANRKGYRPGQTVPDITKQRLFKAWFGASKVVKADGSPMPVYRGDYRGDKVGNKFKVNKATSGRFYFTDDPEIASKYATGKPDLSNVEEHYGQNFTFPGLKYPRERNAPNLDQAWYRLSEAQKASVKNVVENTTMDDDGKIKFDAGQSIYPNDHLPWMERQHRGNWLKIAQDIWLDSGNLFNREPDFEKIMEKAGLETTYDSAHLPRSVVTPVYLSIKKPLDTSAIPQEVISRLDEIAKSDRSRQAKYGVDQWDKSMITTKEWVNFLHDDIEKGTSHAWTRVPEKVTKALQSMGYDGIKDTGGKMGGSKHNVWIAFEPNQIKSSVGNRGTFSPDSDNILHSGVDPIAASRAVVQTARDINYGAGKVADYVKDTAIKTAEARSVDDKLFGLGKQYEADVLRAIELMKQVGPLSTPADQAAIYHHLEDSSVPLDPKQQAVLDKIVKPLMSQSSAIRSELNSAGVPMGEEGYVHRVVQGRSSQLERAMRGKQGTGKGNVLSKSAASLKQRKMFALEDEDGNRQVVAMEGGRITGFSNGSPTDLGASPRLHVGDNFNDKNRKPWTLQQATTKEIESATSLKYYKNALASAVTDYLQLLRAKRANDALESMKSDPGFNQMAFKSEKGSMPPDGWQPVNLPQFRDYYFEPHMAEVLNRFAKELHPDPVTFLEKIGNFMTASLLLNPVRHIYNIGNHWLVERGVSGVFNPLTWPTGAKAGMKAIKAVVNQNDDFLSALDRGAPMMSHRTDMQALHHELFQTIVGHLEKNPSIANKIAEFVGYEKTGPDDTGVVNTVARGTGLRMLNNLRKMGQKAMWMSNDMMMLQSTYEKMAGGTSFDDAMAQTEKHIPNYRIPTRIMNSRAIGDFMGSRLASMFGRYHYGVWKSYGEMAKEALRPGATVKERMRGLDHLVMLGLITFIMYPLWKKLLEKLTGNKDARMVISGASAAPHSISEIIKGNEDPSQLLRNTFTPAILPQAAAEAMFNRDFFSGAPVRNPKHSAGKQVIDVSKHFMNALGPVQQYNQATRNSQPTRSFLLSQVGVSTSHPKKHR